MPRGCFLIISHKQSTRIPKLGWIRALSRYNIDYVIAVGDPSLTEPIYDEKTHRVILPCADTYASLPQKVQAGFQFVEEIFRPIYVCKIDDDVVLDPEKLITRCSELQGYYDYVGYIVFNHFTLYCGGPLYYLSRRALLALQTMDTLFNSNEDICVGHHLASGSNMVILSEILYTNFKSEVHRHIAYHNKLIDI